MNNKLGSPYITPYPRRISITIHGSAKDGTEDQQWSLYVVDDEVRVDCEHHEQCGEAYQPEERPWYPPDAFGAALSAILQTNADEINEGRMTGYADEE